MKSRQNPEKLSHEYDSYIKTVLKNFKKDHIRRNRNKWENESYLEDLSFSARENLMKTKDDVEDNAVFLINDKAYSREKIRNAVDLLPGKKSIVIILHFYDELSDTKIAEILGITRKGVSKRKREGLELLKELLEDDDHDCEE